MADTYFVISINEDGDIEIDPHTKEELEDHLNEECWGEHTRVLSQIYNTDPYYWGTEGPPGSPYADRVILIIKGKIVVPEASRTVTALEERMRVGEEHESMK